MPVNVQRPTGGPVVVGIDLGTGSVKVVAIEAGGTVVASAGRDYPLLHHEPGAAEQDPDVWWDAVRAATREVTAAAPRVAAVGLTGQMHGAVFLDEDGRPARPAVTWADTRSGPQARAIEEEVGRDRLPALTGTAVAAGFQAASTRWLRETEPEVWGRVRHVLLPKDEIRRRLTGELSTEPSDAAGTGMLSVSDRSWAPGLLSAAGFSVAMLPRVVASRGSAGVISAAAAAETGLPAGTPVVGGAGDAPAGALAAGVVEEGDLLLSISSGAQVLAPVREPRVDPALRVHTFASALDPEAGEPGWNVMGATMVAGLAVRWLRDDVFGMAGPDAFAELEALAAAVPAGADGLLFLPYLVGERTPHLDPDARAIFLGLSAAHGRGHLVRAAMEGAIFALLDAYAVVRELVPAPPRRVVLAGGGSRSPLWRQIVADVFGRPVSPLAVGEQSAVGAAMLAAAYVRRVPVSEVAWEWVRLEDPVEPDPAHVERYAALYDLYRELYPMHREHFRRLRAIPGR